MRTFCRILAFISVLALVSSAYAAITSPGKAGLLPGGQTIAGPGAIRNLPAGEQVLLFFFQGFAEGGLDICVTVVNTGKGNIQVQLYGDAGGSLFVEPGRTQIICESDVDNAGATCQVDGKPCSFLWRVDEVRSGH